MKAYLDSTDVITVEVAKYYYNGETNGFYLRINGDVFPCELVWVKDGGPFMEYTLRFDHAVSADDEILAIDRYGTRFPVGFRFIVKTQWFEDNYSYDGELGALYSPESTLFRVWTPTAQRVIIELKQDGDLRYLPMERGERGVFELKAEGDLRHALYNYVIVRTGETVRCGDPYALSSTADRLWCAVIDPAEITSIEDVPVEPCTDPVIYETNIRDMTSYFGSDGHTAGRYLSLFDPIPGIPDTLCAADYLASLGITHVQFQPLHDFEGIDELHPLQTYNWGYNPVSFLSPEGSYSSDPEDPYSRVTELRRMIVSLHERGLRVVTDTVFNHLFDFRESDLDRTVPYYYFRYRPDGMPSNGSFCGNDLDSERTMVRRLFMRAVDVWFGLYGINGMRLDLMGILDTDTVNQVKARALAYDRSALIYGEGWDMPTELEAEKKAVIANEGKMPGVGHFNDRYRDVLKGGTGDDRLGEKGWLTGGDYSFDDVKLLLEGSPHIFSDPSHSVNYFESHDNGTLWDKLWTCCQEDQDTLRKRQRLMIKVLLLSRGIPFLHSGMEYYGTKYGSTNSYSAGDAVNGFNWHRWREEQDAVQAVREATALRKRLDISKLQVSDYYGLCVMDYGDTEVIVNPVRENRFRNTSEVPALDMIILEKER